MKRSVRIIIVLGIVAAALGASVTTFTLRPELRRASTWQRLASPGPVSSAHAFLETNCAACHTPTKGPEATRCIVCHANDTALLQREPTAFHANIESCRECHSEHRGRESFSTVMDHEALAHIGLRKLKEGARSDLQLKAASQELLAWIDQGKPKDMPHARNPRLEPIEASLRCVSCHATKDRHRAYFGQDCAECHSTSEWSIPEFRHPSPQSRDCAQCHEPPPSHCMEHFHMVSAPVAGHHEAKVEQCYLCHQTTSWNDIKGVGWYKHH